MSAAIKVSLAPLAGVTDWPFRLLCFEHGCDEATTEMVSAIGYCFSPKGQATTNLLYRHPQEGPLKLQLFGKESSYMARAAEELSRIGRFSGIDINMGCPAPKIAGSGEGSGLMKTPELAAEILQAVVKASALPVSVKMRLGWDDAHINVLDFAKMAEDAGVSEIAVHGRTREQMYAGTANWDWIAKVQEAVSVPVVGNGDIFTASDAMQRLQETHVAGIMIARGAMGNPWIFEELHAAIEGRMWTAPTPLEKIQLCIRHYDMLLEWKPERVAVGEMRKHIAWYIKGLRGATTLRAKINLIESPEEVKTMLWDFAGACMAHE